MENKSRRLRGFVSQAEELNISFYTAIANSSGREVLSANKQ